MLLDRMDRIAELNRSEIVFHGGTFTEYAAAIEAARRSAEDEIRNAGQQLKRERRQLQEARERAARRSGAAARRFADGGIPRLVAGGLELPDTAVPAGRTVVAARGLQVAHDGRAFYEGNGVCLDVRGPERIALTGRNGAGKSTLLRA